MKKQFKQKAKVGVAGLFQNQMMGNNSTLPEVGKGATQLHYSDRSCYEVIEVSEDFKTVKLECLDAEWDRTKANGQGHQNWILKPTGQYITVVWKWGAWRIKGQKIMFTEQYAEKLGSKFYGSEDYEKCHAGGKLIVVEGITELVTEYNKISLLFGVKDYHYDWEF